MYRQDNLAAALLMIIAMAAFAVEDLFLKSTAMSMSPGQVTSMTGAAGAVIFSLAARARGQPTFSRKFLSAPVILRNLSEAGAAMLYMSALALIPLTLNVAILQASPLVTTMGAALVLGERVGWRRWSAIGLGFAGVLVILQPAGEGFRPPALLTVGCVIVLAIRDLVTRAMPGDVGTLQLTTWAYASLVPAGWLLMLMDGSRAVAPEPWQWAALAVALVSGIAGYYTITLSLRMGEISVVTPLRYTRLVFSAGLAMLFLAERPDHAVIAGSAIVVLSGIYTFWREARSVRQRAKAFHTARRNV
ncbi:MAG: DMT family transporter [Rhodobacteraceae bacterium]|nr:DMT family transporter [Paracoccaceae bacterium]